MRLCTHRHQLPGWVPPCRLEEALLGRVCSSASRLRLGRACSSASTAAGLDMLLSKQAAVQVSDRALAQPDPKAALRAVMKSWLPLSEAVLGMAVEQLPDPASAAPERLPRLLALAALDGMASPLSPSVQQVRW